MYGYYLRLFWSIANTKVRAHQRFSMYHRFIICFNNISSAHPQGLYEFSNLYSLVACSTNVSISYVEASVSFAVRNFRTTSSISFPWPDHKDSTTSSNCTVLPLTLLQKTFSSKISTLCDKILCLSVVIEEYPTIWDNLESNTYFKKIDGTLFSVKAIVSKALH